MVSGNAIRGTRVGGRPASMPERGEPAPRQFVDYWCANGHQTRPSFAIRAEIPTTWECRRCGLPAGTDPESPPERPTSRPYKTHLAYVMERRSAAEGEALLAEALANLRASREAAA
ncbi:RNA polymerase binding protein RbpA [Stackebrandtia albiflava]|uniref:RNA polymerase-binding protein RbpA n=1 Tax=Stackebrandtia albiflava TaxID=406432 RepID=A0A562VD52_9ACTN|nr:RNA polymerase-binding protein RbpA [Stackebrandtia albiflava]TWJ15800.1 RNA polymerase binding protein RbpA [Stackebrandtia albiflava]